MASVNKAIIVGNLGKDPEVRYTADGAAICNFSVATTETWNDKKSGEKKEVTEWHRISFFGRIAEVCAQYLKKGSSVYIEGRIQTRKWQDKDGNDRYTTEIVGERMQMLGGRGSGSADAPMDGHYEDAEPAAAPRRAAPSKPANQPAQNNSAGFDEIDDDIPF